MTQAQHGRALQLAHAVTRLLLLGTVLLASALVSVAHSADRVWALHCEPGSVDVAGEVHARAAVDLGLFDTSRECHASLDRTVKDEGERCQAVVSLKMDPGWCSIYKDTATHCHCIPCNAVTGGRCE